MGKCERGWLAAGLACAKRKAREAEVGGNAGVGEFGERLDSSDAGRGRELAASCGRATTKERRVRREGRAEVGWGSQFVRE